MQVNIFGTLQLVIGGKTVQVDFPGGGTVRELIEEIVRQFPAMRPELTDDSGSLRKDLPLFVNGRNPRLLPDSIDTALQPDDIISLFSPVSSGRMNVDVLRLDEPEQEEH